MWYSLRPCCMGASFIKASVKSCHKFAASAVVCIDE